MKGNNLMAAAMLAGTVGLGLGFAWSQWGGNGPIGVAHAEANERGGHGSGFDRFCTSADLARWNLMVPAVASDLGLDETQNVAFEAFADSMRAGLAGLQAACPPEGTESASAPESFARWQQMADAASAALDQAKPPFDAFYASLDESQRARFDAYFEKHGQR